MPKESGLEHQEGEPKNGLCWVLPPPCNSLLSGIILRAIYIYVYKNKQSKYDLAFTEWGQCPRFRGLGFREKKFCTYPLQESCPNHPSKTCPGSAVGFGCESFEALHRESNYHFNNWKRNCDGIIHYSYMETIRGDCY